MHNGADIPDASIRTQRNVIYKKMFPWILNFLLKNKWNNSESYGNILNLKLYVSAPFILEGIRNSVCQVTSQIVPYMLYTDVTSIRIHLTCVRESNVILTKFLEFK